MTLRTSNLPKNKRKGIGKKIAGILFAIGCIPMFLQYSIEGVAYFQDRVTISEAKNLLNKEKEKLGLAEDISLNCSGSLTNVHAYTERIDSKRGIIYVENDGLKPVILKHELYHRYLNSRLTSEEFSKDHISNSRNRLKSMFIEEPRCNIYSLFGLKI